LSGTAAENGVLPHQLTGPGAAGKNIILVVEDNADLRGYIRSTLEPGYTVVEAKNGQEGIEKAKSLVPDLIARRSC
jgi:PleD family two-component response regulator